MIRIRFERKTGPESKWVMIKVQRSSPTSLRIVAMGYIGGAANVRPDRRSKAGSERDCGN
ncbi:MAG: hypothetical protein WBC82_10880 [Dehalococcoidia bacterium]